MSQRQQRERQVVSMKKWAAEADTGGRTSYKVPEGMKLFKRKQPGSFKLDFIPYKVGKGNPSAAPGEYYAERTFYIHFGIGPNSSAYVCPARTANGKCPICEHRFKILDSEDMDEKQKKAMADALRAKKRQLWLVMDADDRDAGVQLWDVSFHNFGEALKDKIDNQEDGDDFDLFADPVDGMTVKINAKEASMGSNKYLEFVPDRFIKRKEPLDVDVDEMPCLDDLLIIEPYEKLKKIFLQLDEDEEEGDKKSNGRAGKGVASRKTSRQDDEDDEDDEDEEEETPRKARTSRKDEDDEEEEEVKPSRKPSKKDDDDEEEETSGVPEWAKEGEIVFYKGLECDVQKVSKDGTSLTLEDAEGEVHRGVSWKDCVSYADGMKAKVKAKPADDDDDDEEEEEKPKTRKRK